MVFNRHVTPSGYREELKAGNYVHTQELYSHWNLSYYWKIVE